MEHMIEHFIHEDSENSDSAHHKHIRHEIEEPLHTPDDVEFTKEEILAVLEVRSWQGTGTGQTVQRNSLENFQALSHLPYRVI
jgi:hypothetical protein